MKTNLSKATFAAIAGIALCATAPVALADVHEKAKEKMEQKSRQVSGKVLQIKGVEVRGADITNAVALIQTKKGDHRLIVDLGPVEAAKVKKGDNIKVEGKMVQIDDRKILVAHRLMVGDGEAMKVDRKAQEQKTKN